MNVNGTLLGIEKRLSSLGLPAGPDNLINHKALLGLMFGIFGALIGWLLTEPYTEDFTFWRDFLILTGVGMMICFFIMLTDWVFERTLWSFARAVCLSVLSTAVIIAPSVFLTKNLLTPATKESALHIQAGVNPIKVLVLDVSGSMQGYALDTLKRAVQAYVNVVQQNDKEKRTKLACVVFSNRALIVAEPTTDWRMFLEKVNGIRAGGDTNMAEGLLFAENIFKKYGSPSGGIRTTTSRSSGPEKKVFVDEVIIVSDGYPNVPNVNKALADVMDRLKFFANERYPVHAVGAGNEYDRSLMEQIALKTGGVFVSADEVSRLIPVMEKFAYQGLTQSGRAGDEKIGPWSRIIGWVIIGVAIGICAALPRKSVKVVSLGVIGGLTGGLMGSLLFEAIQYAVGLTPLESGLINRCIGFMVLGASIGFAVPVVESVGRPAWIRIIEGGQTGRVAPLDKVTMVLGSGRKADIRIPDDPGVATKHIRLTKVGENLEVESMCSDGFSINGVNAKKGSLTHEDKVLVGSTEFIYLNKLTGFGIQKGGFERLDLSGYQGVEKR